MGVISSATAEGLGIRMHAGPQHAVLRPPPWPCFLGAFVACVGASLVAGAGFFGGLDELAPTSPAGVSLWRPLGFPILFAAFGFVAGPACFGEDRHGGDT